MKIVVRETQPNHLKTKLEWIGLSFSLLFADKVGFFKYRVPGLYQKGIKPFFTPIKERL